MLRPDFSGTDNLRKGEVRDWLFFNFTYFLRRYDRTVQNTDKKVIYEVRKEVKIGF